MQPLNPATVSPVLLQAIDAVTEKQAFSDEQVANAVGELSRLFTKDRATVSRPYLEDRIYLAAYMTYFMPVNLSKIQILLGESPGDAFVKSPQERFAVLDVGSGPGTAGLAVLDWVHRHHESLAGTLSVVALDASGSALRHGEKLWDIYCRTAAITGARLRSHEADLERAFSGPLGDEVSAAGPYDLIILANCLNEMFLGCRDPIDHRVTLVTDLLSLLTPLGTVMIVEPALRETSRALHQVRDRLLQENRCTVYSPCLHELDCPALIHPDDWCHEERSWNPPSHILEIDEKVGFIKDALKFSYLMLRKDGRTIAPRDPQTFRIVSELRELKGDTRAWVCNELGRSEIGRLDRAESGVNAAWSECQRGTIVRIDALKRRDGATLARIPTEGTVQIVRPI